MMRIIFIFILILKINFTNEINAQEDAEVATEKPPEQVINGKTADLKQAFIKEEEKPYTYQPADPEFWSTVQNYLKEENPIAALVESAKKMDQKGKETLEGTEAFLALTQGLKERHFLYASFYFLVQIAQEKLGTSIGEAALFELNQFTQNNIYDEETLHGLLINNEFGGLHPEINSFISYFKAMDLLQFGFEEWAQVYLKSIKKNSYWDQLLQYWTAVGEVSRNRIDNAIILFQKLMNEVKADSPLFERIALQYARLVFEQGDFPTALTIYNNLGIKGVREIGRIQLERAWVHYYLKDYSKAMGILAALKAPYFEPSLTFERHILEMIIYRDLCHYAAVESVAHLFRQDFAKSLETIRKRQPLREDKALFNMAVIHRDIQEEANLIDQIRREKILLENYNWDSFSFYKPLLDEYSRIDQLLQARIDRRLESKARDSANELLDAEEQVLFLEYTSRIDQLRVRPSDEANYKSQEISHLTFEKIFWPADGEYWWDELPDYSMLISSRCGDTQLPDDQQLEKNFK